jgi:hypothetical protein
MAKQLPALVGKPHQIFRSPSLPLPRARDPHRAGRSIIHPSRKREVNAGDERSRPPVLPPICSLASRLCLDRSLFMILRRSRSAGFPFSVGSGSLDPENPARLDAIALDF